MVPPPSLQNTPHSFAQSGCQFDLVFVYALVSKILFVGIWEAQKASWIRILFERRYKWESTVSQDKPRVDSGSAIFLYTNIVFRYKSNSNGIISQKVRVGFQRNVKNSWFLPYSSKNAFHGKLQRLRKPPFTSINQVGFVGHISTVSHGCPLGPVHRVCHVCSVCLVIV